jgi:SET domain
MWDQFIKNTVFTKSRVIGSFHHAKPNEMNILTQQGMTIEALRKQESTRTIEWLQKYGTCGDHLTIRKSTIPQAGRGAFAYRTLPKGTKVAQLPMIHISDRAILTMYNFVNIQGEQQISYLPSKGAGVMGKQLLLNYCYGHQHSTILLCPYGPLTNYVNHNQTRANVKLVWGRVESGNHMPAYLEKPIEELIVDKTAKLAMELVAIRDIEEGEEILLDYGNEWEEAWTKHIQTWKPVQGSERYKSSTDFNSGSDKLPTIFEQINGTATLFPPNVAFKCDNAYTNVWHERTLHHFQQYHVPDYWECTILSSKILDSGLDVYDVHLFRNPNKVGDEDLNEHSTVHGIARGIPRVAIRFYDTPYTHDIHLPNAFRHDIRIPDELFPEVWKNQF